MKDCYFCSVKKYDLENNLAFANYDDFPVSKGHMIFMTKRHCETFFDTTKEERLALFELIDEAKKIIDSKFHPDGYNIGVNCNKAGGQSVMHVHIHLIPRYLGDVENPKGGVRGIIQNKQAYHPSEDIKEKFDLVNFDEDR